MMHAYISSRILPDGRGLYVYLLTYGRARLGISPPSDLNTFTDEW